MKPCVTVLIPCGNSIDVLDACLNSASWADEVLVVDSFSTDGSFELAKEKANRVLRHEYIYSAKQKNWAIPQAKYEWVFILDTDERISEKLREEVLQVLDNPQYDAYWIPRRNYFLNQPLSAGGYYPDKQIRLFRRDKAKYEDRRVHAHMIVNGSVGEMETPIEHYAIRDLHKYEKHLINEMTDWEADARIEELRFSKLKIIDLYFRPTIAFILRYFYQAGWKDGRSGYFLALVWAKYIHITYKKVWKKLGS